MLAAAASDLLPESVRGDLDHLLYPPEEHHVVALHAQLALQTLVVRVEGTPALVRLRQGASGRAGELGWI